MHKRNNGIICNMVRKTAKIIYLEVLGKDSVYYRGVTYTSDNFSLNKGFMIFFSYNYNNDSFVFYIEDVKNFFGYYFWDDLVLLDNFNCLLKICSKNLPNNIYIENLYEEFMKNLKNISFEKNKFKDFESWILL